MSSTSAACTKTVMSLRITLTSPNIKPRVWRRILVPREYTFKDLSVAIDCAMGWDGYPYHLYEYSLRHPRTYRKIEIGGFCDYHPITKVRKRYKLADVFTDSRVEVIYDYDMGSTKTHVINWEKNVPAVKGEKYPKCIGGERSSPPEEDPGSDYSYSDVEQNFHHSKVDMRRCRQVMGIPKENKVKRKKLMNRNAKSSEKNVSTAEENTISSGISDPSIAAMQYLPNGSSSSTAKTRTIATETSGCSTVTVSGSTRTRSFSTYEHLIDDCSSDESSYTIYDEVDYSSSSPIRSPVATAQDGLDDSSASGIQNHLTNETDQDVEDMDGEDVASQMRLVPNEVSQISAPSTVIGDTISSPVATVQDELDDSSSSGIQNHMENDTDQDVEDMDGEDVPNEVSQISAPSTMIGDIFRFIHTFEDKPDDSFSSSSHSIKDEVHCSPSSHSPVATVQDKRYDTSSSGIQGDTKKETDKDVEDMYGKYIASQIRLVPDLEAREDMRCDIQSVIKKYRFQKK